MRVREKHLTTAEEVCERTGENSVAVVAALLQVADEVESVATRTSEVADALERMVNAAEEKRLEDLRDTVDRLKQDYSDIAAAIAAEGPNEV